SGAHVHRGSAWRDASRHVAQPPGSVRDDGGGDPGVGVLRRVSLAGRPRARERGPLADRASRCRMTTETKPKNWYIVHTYSGFENKVKESLEQRVAAYGLQDEIGEILIPTEDVVEKRGGREVKSARRFFPGYILVEMTMSDHAWHVVKNTPKV